MTDVDCLYDKNPRTYPDARAIEVVEEIGALQADGTCLLPFSSSVRNNVNVIRVVSSAGSSLGTGGMSTKIVAARLATSVGVTTVITRSSNPGNITNIITYVQALKTASPSITSQPSTPPSGRSISSASTVVEEPLSRSTASLKLEPPLVAPLHTRFIPSPQPIRDRYFWLLHGLTPHGTIYIDSGACRALENKAGLLPVGVVDVEGTFSQYEAVRLVVVERLPKSALSPGGTNRAEIGGTIEGVVNGSGKSWEGTGVEVGRALVNYSATEVARIKGVRSDQIEGLLGYAETEYVALRENISFFKRESRPVTPSLEL
jgi:glutamate 5-kinase